MAQAVKECGFEHEEVGLGTHRVVAKNEWGGEAALHVTAHLLGMGWESWQYCQDADALLLAAQNISKRVALTARAGECEGWSVPLGIGHKAPLDCRGGQARPAVPSVAPWGHKQTCGNAVPCQDVPPSSPGRGRSASSAGRGLEHAEGRQPVPGRAGAARRDPARPRSARQRAPLLS